MYNKTVVSLEVTKNCMRLIRDGLASDAFEALGISRADFELCCSSHPYIGADRPRITQVLNALTHGTLDVVGLPRIEVPAEFRAAVIACFVHAGNLAVACRWLESGFTAGDISAGGDVEPVTARQLFALCVQMVDDGSTAQAAWRKRTGRAVDEALGKKDPAPEKEGIKENA